MVNIGLLVLDQAPAEHLSQQVAALLERVPLTSNHLLGVMAGLVPAIYVFSAESAKKKDVDARDKRGHDGGEVIQSRRNAL